MVSNRLSIKSHRSKKEDKSILEGWKVNIDSGFGNLKNDNFNKKNRLRFLKNQHIKYDMKIRPMSAGFHNNMRIKSQEKISKKILNKDKFRKLNESIFLNKSFHLKKRLVKKNIDEFNNGIKYGNYHILDPLNRKIYDATNPDNNIPKPDYKYWKSVVKYQEHGGNKRTEVVEKEVVRKEKSELSNNDLSKSVKIILKNLKLNIEEK